MRHACLFLMFLLFLSLSTLGAEDVSFQGGYTQMKMQQGYQTISLGGGAQVVSGSLELKADTIELSGKDFRYINCSGKVSLIDSERQVTLSATKLFFDRVENLVIIDGYFELQDLQNQIQASAFRMEFDLDQGLLLLQARVRLAKHTDDGPMVCRADSMQYDRKKKLLDLGGDATIEWAPDHYEAQKITVDLDTDEIRMDGAIKGVING